MPESDISKELTDLRSQLESLKANRLSGNPPTSTETVETPDVSEDLADSLSMWLDEDGGLDPDRVISTLRNSGLDWLDGFNEDLAEAKPSSVLAVFAMGFLVGKLSA